MSSQEALNTAAPFNELFSLMGICVWDWELTTGKVSCSAAWKQTLGYTPADMEVSIAEWRALVHSEDLPLMLMLLEYYLNGKIPAYECEIRVRHHDGSYIWMRDVAKIAARDPAGKPVRLVGGRLNIDEQKRTETQMTEVLERNYISMENAAERHTLEMAEQGRLLGTINQISRKLLTVQANRNSKGLVQDCLCLLGESVGKNRVFIAKDCTNSTGNTFCQKIYEWVNGAVPIQGNPLLEEISYEVLPSFDAAVNSGRCLNSLVRNLTVSERGILEPRGIQSILIAPLAMNGRRWGFIGVDDCESEQLFTSTEENLLLMSGSMLANTIEKMDTEAALREMEERTQLVLNATPLCCNLWTPDFENMSCNDEAVRLFELSSQDEYLQRFYELSPEFQTNGRRSNDLAGEYISKAFQEGYCRFEWLHQKLDGTPIPAEITLVRIKYKDDFIVAGYTRDLREQKAMLAELQTKEALRRARDEALLISQAKSNFLANMSHEIRTPMNAISGFTDIILRESISDKMAEYARGIKGACNNLLNIINDILDISKIESGKLEIFSSPYELASLLNDAITISRMRLGSKPLMFVTDIDSRIPARLVGDEIRIKQILLNMLSNAIKYTHEGYIALRVSCTVEGSRATLRFSVRDSGVGIKPEDLEKLFEEFERVNTTKNRSIEGTGLGLAISKQLCEMMGGNIHVESTYGVGSEFVAIIPQECPSYEWLAQVKESKSVLLYEPRERYRFSIAETLENLGCKCISCANQSALYRSIGAMQYDYILTAALHQKKVQATVQKNKLSVPVAVFADYGETVLGNGVYTIMFPVNCLQLSALLNGQHEEADYSRRKAGANFIAPSARVLVVDDNPVNLQVAKGLMEPYRFAIDTAVTGVEAVRKVTNTEYDLVFMDHMMPEMDGVDATVAIRKLEGPAYKTLPIIALTANALVGTREMFIREGMNDFLAKPIELNKLAQILVKWLPKSKVIDSLPQDSTKPEGETPVLEIPGVNTAQGIFSVGGKRENYFQILSAYYADGMKKCTSLLRHLTKNDIAAFRTEVHALKSTSATIGAGEVSSMAAKLEVAALSSDTGYIDSSIDQFLTRFQALLQAIQTVLPSDTVQAGSAEKVMGDISYLEKELDSLQEAAEFIHISQIEEGIGDLQEYMWPEEVTAALMAMQKYLSVFDYDGILQCVIGLKEFLKA